MEYRILGRSGLKVSALSMGTMTFGGQGWFSKTGSSGLSEAARLIDLCVDSGVNLIDTSNKYSDGLSEEIIGQALSNSKHKGILLATKARFAMGDGPNERGASRYHLMQACEASLRRLKTETIDLYQIHGWDGVTPVEETIEALDRLVQDGKVRYVGCSNYSGWHLMKSLAASDVAHRVRFISQQLHYSLESRDAEFELVPIAIDQGTGILVWSPLAGGLLSGKHSRLQGAPEGSRQFAGWKEPPIYNEERLWRIVDALSAIAKERQVSSAQIALAWLLQRPAVTSLIIGGRNEDQFRDNLKATAIELTPAEIGALDHVSLQPAPYPYWHQLKMAKDRMSDADKSLLSSYP